MSLGWERLFVELVANNESSSLLHCQMDENLSCSRLSRKTNMMMMIMVVVIMMMMMMIIIRLSRG